MQNIKTNGGKINVNMNKMVELGLRKVAVYGWYIPLIVTAINPGLQSYLPIFAIGMPTCSLLTNELIINTNENSEKSKRV